MIFPASRIILRQHKSFFQYARQISTAKKFTVSSLATDDFTLTKAKNQQISEHNALPLHLAITAKAAEKLNLLAQKENNPTLALRLSVSSGGCHGFQYNMEITNKETYKPDDGDSLFIRDGATVIADKDTLEMMRDSKIDYVKELIGEGFKVVESPLAKSSCGCGSSFDVDFEKLAEGK
ncbi:Isa2 protein [Martiniozyma asiatica (nom. inval.)]|nr:Isa2 protein [Martiniozyma asiatica]